jgi:hypothetical protein
MKRFRILNRMGQALAVLGLGATMSIALPNAPAQAATIINVTHEITVPGLVRHQIDVHLPLSQWDAQGYINNGARIEVQCWASDTFPLADNVINGCPNPIGGPAVYSGNELFADDTGVHLHLVTLYEVGSTLNEDFGFRDEIYVKARWVDGDGGVLNARSAIVTGYF